MHLLLCPARQCSRWQSLEQYSAVLQLAHFISCPQSASSVSQFQQCLPASACQQYMSNIQAGRWAGMWSVLAARPVARNLYVCLAWHRLAVRTVLAVPAARCLGCRQGVLPSTPVLACGEGSEQTTASLQLVHIIRILKATSVCLPCPHNPVSDQRR